MRPPRPIPHLNFNYLYSAGVVDGAGGDGHVEQRVGDVAGVAAGQLHLGRGELRGGVVGGEEPRERRRR